MSTIQEIDFNVNLLKAVLWQYNEAGNLQELLQNKNDWYVTNQTSFWDDWYRDVFNLYTANEFGLSVWSIILGQPLFINRSFSGRPTWGFEQYHVNFTRGNFAGSSSLTRLQPETARILLQLRYFQLISSGTIPETNRALKWIFSENYGDAWLLDGEDMTQLYVFTFPVPAELAYVFKYFDVLPRPAGVGSDFIVVLNETWGFGEFHENYDNGNFSEL